ncbi:MAG: hypothetical protein IPK74_09640 [Deltaproteobacteria bacterium]|nr:hypothetical protein [Deltaproteobacteria bacterium]
MMKPTLAAALSLVLTACVILDNGDDAGDSGSSSASASSATAGTTAGTTAATTAAGTDASSGSSSDSAADSGTAGPAGCGWGATGEKTVPMGYVCGGEGEDPSGMISSACPDGIDLVEGGDCGGNMGITGVGCCDGTGNVWFCAGEGDAAQLYTQAC